MSELCTYTSLNNALPQLSVFGFLPPNWAWWAWHLIVCPLWESHPLSPLQWQLQSQIFKNHVAQKLQGDWCMPAVTYYLNHIKYEGLITLHRSCLICPQSDHSTLPLAKFYASTVVLCEQNRFITVTSCHSKGYNTDKKHNSYNELYNLPTYTKQPFPVKLFRSAVQWGQKVVGWSTPDPLAPPSQLPGTSAWVVNRPTHDKVRLRHKCPLPFKY